jgi:hypothetical protein
MSYALGLNCARVYCLQGHHRSEVLIDTNKLTLDYPLVVRTTIGIFSWTQGKGPMESHGHSDMGCL